MAAMTIAAASSGAGATGAAGVEDWTSLSSSSTMMMTKMDVPSTALDRMSTWSRTSPALRSAAAGTGATSSTAPITFLLPSAVAAQMPAKSATLSSSSSSSSVPSLNPTHVPAAGGSKPVISSLAIAAVAAAASAPTFSPLPRFDEPSEQVVLHEDTVEREHPEASAVVSAVRPSPSAYPFVGRPTSSSSSSSPPALHPSEHIEDRLRYVFECLNRLRTSPSSSGSSSINGNPLFTAHIASTRRNGPEDDLAYAVQSLQAMFASQQQQSGRSTNSAAAATAAAHDRWLVETAARRERAQDLSHLKQQRASEVSQQEQHIVLEDVVPSSAAPADKTSRGVAKLRRPTSALSSSSSAAAVTTAVASLPTALAELLASPEFNASLHDLTAAPLSQQSVEKSMNYVAQCLQVIEQEQRQRDAQQRASRAVAVAPATEEVGYDVAAVKMKPPSTNLRSKL